MKGIYLKDLLQIRASWIVLAIVSISVTGILIWYDGEMGLTDFFMIFLAMQGSATIFADKMCGWYRMSTTFPITRKRLVESKYRLAVVLAAIGFVIGLALMAIVILIRTGSVSVDGEQFLINLYIGVIIVFSTMAILIPLAYLMRKNQGFIAVFASMIPAALMIFAWTQRITHSVVWDPSTGAAVSEQIDMQLGFLSGMAVFSVLLFVLSYFIMPKFIARQDQR